MKILIGWLAAAAALLAAPAAPAAPTSFSVAVEGEGPDVILIPGLMSGRQVWDGAAASLSDKYRVHRLQVGGFAGEPAPAGTRDALLPALVSELAGYIDTNRLERPAIVGHSMGGLVGLMLADAHPELAGRLLIVDALPFYPLLFGRDTTAAQAEPRAAAFRDALAGMSDAAFAAQQPQAVAAMAATEAARAQVLRDSLASDRRVAAQAVYEVMTTDMRGSLPRLGVPLTVAYAVNAVATEESAGALYRDAYAGARAARFVPVADSRHFLMLDQPERFNRLLAEFLAAKR